MVEIRLREHFSANFKELVEDVKEHNHTHYMLKGGRGSIKSSAIGKLIPLLLMKNKDCHAVVVRKNWSTLKGSVYNQMIWCINELGISHLFDVYKSPLKLVLKATKQEIIFWGCDDPTKAKGATVQFGRIGIVWFEEIDQFSSMAEIRNMTQSFIRKEGENWLFYSFNPPLSMNNWTNSESEKIREDRMIVHSDYRSVPPEWLGTQFIKEAEYLKESNFRAYQHEYLGLAVGTGGNVFQNVEICDFTKEDYELFDNVLYGVDFGFAIDPATWVKLYYHNNKLWIIDEIYEQQLSNEELAERIRKKEPDIRNKFIICDSAEPKSIAELKRLGLNTKKARKGPDSRNFGYKWLQSLDKIYISRKCEKAIKEFTGYEYARNKEGEFISKYPDGEDHIIDAVRYATEELSRKKSGWGVKFK